MFLMNTLKAGNKPVLYLFVGYPGAGKTTISKLIHASTGAVHIWADHERSELFEAPSHSQAESRLLYDILNKQTDRLLRDGKSVIFDTNFNFRADRDKLRRIAARAGAEVVLVWVTTPRDIAALRAVHQSHNGHTRVYGNMTHHDFSRIASRLEPPAAEEMPIAIDGTSIDQSAVLKALNIK